MDNLDQLLEQIPIPKMVRVSQSFERPRIEDLEAHVRHELRIGNLLASIKKNDRVAIAVGSRGIANQPQIVQVLVDTVYTAGGKPFIIPAMGSHGGATAEGQKKMLLRMGISEQIASIQATMDVEQVGTTTDGLPVYIDANAYAADAIIIVNRIKPHVAFRSRYESGLMKMISIGLGKQKGAEICHSLGVGALAENILALARVTLQKSNILFGVAVLENAYHETCKVEVIKSDEIEHREPELLEEAKTLTARLYFEQLDVLIIDEIGKDISGTGFDTNVVGRYHTPYASGGPEITRIAALDISEKSHGNGNGLGILDFTTRRVFEKFKFEQTYPNALTSTIPLVVKIPMVLASDRRAVQAAIRTCNIPEFSKVRMARIKNTLQLQEIEISENLVPNVSKHSGLEILSTPYELAFDKNGNLF